MPSFALNYILLYTWPILCRLHISTYICLIIIIRVPTAYLFIFYCKCSAKISNMKYIIIYIIYSKVYSSNEDQKHVYICADEKKYIAITLQLIIIRLRLLCYVKLTSNYGAQCSKIYLTQNFSSLLCWYYKTHYIQKLKISYYDHILILSHMQILND